ncbi:hypothetical protein PQX77_008992 [Marasmius sp. AFHP31]|nr:hypothetical protein PQX77_008992 [Marasmius sp. AFHP31]
MNEDIVFLQFEEDSDDYEEDSVHDNLIKKATLDCKDPSAEDSDTPQLLAVLLKGEYPRIPEYDSSSYPGKLDQEYCPLKVLLLKEPDRKLLAGLAPFAKAYGFDIHLGQSTYIERGDLDMGGVEVNSENGSECEYPGDLLEAGFVDNCHDDVCTEDFEIDHVFSLHGIPMDMKGELRRLPGHGTMIMAKTFRISL